MKKVLRRSMMISNIARLMKALMSIGFWLSNLRHHTWTTFMWLFILFTFQMTICLNMKHCPMSVETPLRTPTLCSSPIRKINPGGSTSYWSKFVYCCPTSAPSRRISNGLVRRTLHQPVGQYWEEQRNFENERRLPQGMKSRHLAGSRIRWQQSRGQNLVTSWATSEHELVLGLLQYGKSSKRKRPTMVIPQLSISLWLLCMASCRQVIRKDLVRAALGVAGSYPRQRENGYCGLRLRWSILGPLSPSNDVSFLEQSRYQYYDATRVLFL